MMPQMTPARGRPQREFTGWHMLAIMVAFFGVIVTVNITMAVLANRTWTGLVVKNSYVASQQYNGELAAAKTQRARGWKSSLTYTDGGFSLTLGDRLGEPVILPELRLAFGRPATESQDGEIALRHVGRGLYRGEQVLAPGVWAIRVTGGEGANAWRRDSRITVGRP